MTYKDILVLIDTTAQCLARIQLAVEIARQHKAHLSGLYVDSHHFGFPRYEAEAPDIGVLQAQFHQEAALAGVSVDWCVGDWTVSYESVSAVVNHFACLKDLVILGQTQSGQQGKFFPADLPERIVGGSGRPVLIIPSAGNFKTVGGKVMVCWRHGRESVRALTGALPFLEKAAQVRVVTVLAPEMMSKDNQEGKSLSEEVVTHLSRCGVAAQAEPVLSADISVGDMLLNEAWEDGCDLLVMGAYMQTSKGGIKTGPVASHILQHMTLPVLMAH
jgi:nucleotide-binding universal stress UspA family protein